MQRNETRRPKKGAKSIRTGAVVLLPEFSESDQVYEHHLVAARIEPDNFGLADPSVFAAKLQKAG